VEAAKAIDASRPKVLFPMQMQPESSTDVWGRPYVDQARLIRDLAAGLGGTATLLIKANPKWRFEANEALLAAVRDVAGVVPLPKARGMLECMAMSDVVVTVTGTVAIECVIRRKPLVVLSGEYLAGTPGIARVGHPRELGPRLAGLLRGEPTPASDADCRRLIAERWALSYEGIISDPASDLRCLDPRNVTAVARGLDHVLEVLGSAGENPVRKSDKSN
jgi:hypothetical protein